MSRFAVVLALVGCIGGDGSTSDSSTSGTSGVPQFGAELNPSFTVLARAAKDLAIPRDLAFNPDRPDELWTANRDDDLIVVLFATGTESQTEETFADRDRSHFLEEVSSIAYGDNGNWASCQESRNTYNGLAPPNDFMGPALWPGDLDIFAQVNQAPSDPLLGSHLDMLHQSPNCMGIAHDHGNAYWAFDGLNGHLVYYDFKEPHVIGGDDHSDGVVRRYVEVELNRVADVPGHMVLDKDTEILYIANTGDGSILAVDTTTGDVVDDLPFTNEPLAEYSEMGGAEFSTLATGFDEPSGLALADGRLFVSDHATGEIIALDVTDGAELGRITVPEGEGVMGLEVGPDGLLYYVHGEANVAARVDP